MKVELLIIIAVLIMLLLAMSIVFFVFLYQRRISNHLAELKEFNRQKEVELIQVSIRSEEAERMRIATELHDDVGSTFSSVRLLLYQAIRYPDDEEVVAQTKELLDNGIQKVRDLSHQLLPSTIQYLGLVDALGSLAELITRSRLVQMSFHEPEMGEWLNFDQQTALNVYRIVQEITNNLVKHAQANVIDLYMTHQETGPIITITHDGDGFS